MHNYFILPGIDEIDEIPDDPSAIPFDPDDLDLEDDDILDELLEEGELF